VWPHFAYKVCWVHSVLGAVACFFQASWTNFRQLELPKHTYRCNDAVRPACRQKSLHASKDGGCMQVHLHALRAAFGLTAQQSHEATIQMPSGCSELQLSDVLTAPSRSGLIQARQLHVAVSQGIGASPRGPRGPQHSFSQACLHITSIQSQTGQLQLLRSHHQNWAPAW